VSLDSLLIHQCDIQRIDTYFADAYGNNVATYKTVVKHLLCRLITKSQRVASDDRTQFTVITVYRLLVPGLSDVIVDDRVFNLVLDGTPDSAAYAISAVLPRRSSALHHLSLELERIT